MTAASILDDLAAEEEQLESLLAGLTDEQWSAPSAAAGWSIADVVLHLAQTEEAVCATIANVPVANAWGESGNTVDEIAEEAVRAERAPGPVVFERWRAARTAALDALRNADPNDRLAWAAAPLKPSVLATTRLAEHWAHGLDIAEGLELSFPDTDRLRHIAWLGHRTLPYAFAVAGLEPHDVYCELTSPNGETWQYGDPSTESVIRGPAADFCRVGARRLKPDKSRLATEGPHAAAALRALRNYAA